VCDFKLLNLTTTLRALQLELAAAKDTPLRSK
jgi:hypothetical protein